MPGRSDRAPRRPARKPSAHRATAPLQSARRTRLAGAPGQGAGAVPAGQYCQVPDLSLKGTIMQRLHHDPARIASPNRSLRQAAHECADMGWPVFPCRPGGKIPVTSHGYLDATVDHAQIERWWTSMPRASIAIATGTPGPDVLDVDVHGRDGFAALRRARQAGLIPTPIRAVRTPSGGAHLYFPGTAQRTSTLPGLGLDFRAAGGCVIVPPSWSAEYQRCYDLLSDRSDDGVPVDWDTIRELLQPVRPRPRLRHLAGRDDPGLVTRVVSWLETRPEGNRNYPLFWAARLITAAGLMDNDAREQLIAASMHSGLRGGEREARRTVASGERAGATDARKAESGDQADGW